MMNFYRRLAIPSVVFVNPVLRDDWDCYLRRFESIGLQHTSESVESSSDLAAFRLAIKSLLHPSSTPLPLLLIPYNSGREMWIMPVKGDSRSGVIPQPNDVTCTLACAWMKIRELRGDRFFLENRQLSYLKNDFVDVHFRLVLSRLSDGDRGYRVVSKSFTTAERLATLIHRYGSGAIGIHLDSGLRHWVLLDCVNLKSTGAKTTRAPRYLLGIRDPATCELGFLEVRFCAKKILVFSQDSTLSGATLLGDFTTISR